MKWIKIASKGKPFPIFIMDPVLFGFKKYFTTFHDGKTRIDNFMQADGARWFGEEDMERYKKMLEQNEDRIFEWSEKYLGNFTILENFVDNIGINLKTSTNIELIEILNKFFDLSAKTFCFIYDYAILNKFYLTKLNRILLEKGGSEFNTWLKIITDLDRPIDFHNEQIDLIKIALGQGDLQTHFNKYCYFGTYIYRGKPILIDVFKNKLVKLKNISKGKLENMILEIDHRFIKNHLETEKIINQLDEEEKIVIKNVKSMLYTSSRCDELHSYVSYKIMPLLHEVARRLDISINQILEMTNAEIIEMLNGAEITKYAKNANERIKGCAIILQGEKINILTGNKLKFLLDSLEDETKEINISNGVIGEVACPGKTIGRVKLILGINDLSKFKKDCVLIAVCTIPQYVPAMSIASAIITDEGGILSHAAIMSREFKVPCIIGTKFATKVFKDGDLVEVDADNGIIKKLC